MVSPDEDAQEADEQRGRDHRPIGEDAAAGEVRQQHRGEAHAGKDGDVDLGVSEEPEEMQPEQRGTVAFIGVKDAVDEVARGEVEAGAGVAVAEEQQERGEQDGEGDQGEQRAGEPSPDGEGQALPGHAVAAEPDDGGEGVDCAGSRSDAEQSDTA